MKFNNPERPKFSYIPEAIIPKSASIPKRNIIGENEKTQTAITLVRLKIITPLNG